MADKRRDVAGLIVERAIGIQSRPPPTPNFTSWRFGNLGKLNDRLKASRPSMSGDRVSASISHVEPAWAGEGSGPTIGGDRERQVHEGFATRSCEYHSREETLARAGNVHPGKTQSGRDLQQRR